VERAVDETMGGVQLLGWAGLKEEAGECVGGKWEELVEDAKGTFGLGRIKELFGRLAGVFQVAKQVWKALVSAVKCVKSIFSAIVSAIATGGASLLLAAAACMEAYQDIRAAINGVQSYVNVEAPAIVDTLAAGTVDATRWLGAVGRRRTLRSSAQSDVGECSRDRERCPLEFQNLLMIGTNVSDRGAPVAQPAGPAALEGYVRRAVSHMQANYFWNGSSPHPMSRKEVLQRHGGSESAFSTLQQITLEDAENFADLNVGMIRVEQDLAKANSTRAQLLATVEAEIVVARELQQQTDAMGPSRDAATSTSAPSSTSFSTTVRDDHDLDVEQLVVLAGAAVANRKRVLKRRAFKHVLQMDKACSADPRMQCSQELDFGNNFEKVTAQVLRTQLNNQVFGANPQGTGTAWIEDTAVMMELTREQYPFEFAKFGRKMTGTESTDARFVFHTKPPQESRTVGVQLVAMKAYLLSTKGWGVEGSKIVTVNVRKESGSTFVGLDGTSKSTYTHDPEPFASSYWLDTCKQHGEPPKSRRLLGLYGLYTIDVRSLQIELGDDWHLLAETQSIRVEFIINYASVTTRQLTPLFAGGTTKFPHALPMTGCPQPSWLGSCSMATCSKHGQTLQAGLSETQQCMSADCSLYQDVLTCCAPTTTTSSSTSTTATHMTNLSRTVAATNLTRLTPAGATGRFTCRFRLSPQTFSMTFPCVLRVDRLRAPVFACVHAPVSNYVHQWRFCQP